MTLTELIDEYTTEYSKFIELYGINIHYTDQGKGDVILMLHGVFSSLHTFDKWNELLADNYRIIRIDLPGFGLTGPTANNEYGMQFYVDFIKTFMDILEIDRFYIIGNSLGGWVSWEFAVAYEKRIIKMILVNSAGYIDETKMPLPFVIAQTPVLRKVFNYKVVPKAVVRRFLRQVICDQSMVTDELVNRYYNIVHREGNFGAFLRIANSKYKRNTEALKNLNVPTLVLWGNKDAWISCGDADKFQKDLKYVTVKIYEGVGHVPMEEISETSYYDVRNFLIK